MPPGTQRAPLEDQLFLASDRHSSSLTTFGPGILNSTRCKAIKGHVESASAGVLAVLMGIISQ